MGKYAPTQLERDGRTQNREQETNDGQEVLDELMRGERRCQSRLGRPDDDHIFSREGRMTGACANGRSSVFSHGLSVRRAEKESAGRRRLLA